MSLFVFLPDLFSETETSSSEELIPGLQTSAVDNVSQETGMYVCYSLLFGKYPELLAVGRGGV